MKICPENNSETRLARKLNYGLIILLFALFSGCQKQQEIPENKAVIAETPKASPTVAAEKPLQKIPFDVAKLANKSAAEIDGIFGEPVETEEITIPKKGEYRLYKIAGEPKGLAIRFYGGRAKNFNLILSKPVGTAKEALKKTFIIDVGNKSPLKDKQEPLSEKWSGEFGGVKFTSVYAKRESENKGFVFVLAEVAD